MRWEPFQQVSSWPALGDPFVSRGHAGGRLTASVRVTPAARDAYQQLVRSTVLPAGTILAELLSDPATHRQVALYTMQKDDQGRWRFAVVTPAGIVDPDVLPRLCARCHAEAPADQLFGIPRP